jgi:hypothetical protein
MYRCKMKLERLSRNSMFGVFWSASREGRVGSARSQYNERQNYYTIQEKECSVLVLLLPLLPPLLPSLRRRFPASSCAPLALLSDPSLALVFSVQSL